MYVFLVESDAKVGLFFLRAKQFLNFFELFVQKILFLLQIGLQILDLLDNFACFPLGAAVGIDAEAASPHEADGHSAEHAHALAFVVDGAEDFPNEPAEPHEEKGKGEAQPSGIEQPELGGAAGHLAEGGRDYLFRPQTAVGFVQD